MRDLSVLDSEFEQKVEEVISKCFNDGFDLRPFYTRRDPWTQAKLWRQSRSTAQINKAIKMLKDMGVTWIATVLESVGPQFGRWATNALPGQSWHQFDEGVDCFVLNKQRNACWSSRHPGYICYAQHAKEVGLFAGFFWEHPDAVHLQKREYKVLNYFTWHEIEERLINTFGDNPVYME